MADKNIEKKEIKEMTLITPIFSFIAHVTHLAS